MAVNFITLGDVLTRDPATKGILKSSNMLWCYLLSVPLFKRDSKVFEWCGILLIFLGGFVKVSVSIHGLFPDYRIQDHCNIANATNSTILSNIQTASNLALGDTMFLVGYLFQSCLFIYQEWLMKNYGVPPLRLATWEGGLGLFLQGIILIPLNHIKSISKHYLLLCLEY